MPGGMISVRLCRRCYPSTLAVVQVRHWKLGLCLIWVRALMQPSLVCMNNGCMGGVWLWTLGAGLFWQQCWETIEKDVCKYVSAVLLF